MRRIVHRRHLGGRVATAVLGLLCAGCQLRLGVAVTVDRRGAGRLEVSVAADAELLARAAEAGVDPMGDLVAAGRQLRAQGWDTTDRRQPDGSRQVGLSTGFSDAEEFEALAGDLAAALAAPELTVLEPMDLTVDDERLALVGAASLQPSAAVAELGLSPEEAVDLLREQDAVDYRVRIALPGEVLETTAPQRDGSVLTWPVPPGERVEVRAVGVRPGPPAWPIGLGGLLGALGVGLVLRRRSRRRARPQARS